MIEFLVVLGMATIYPAGIYMAGYSMGYRKAMREKAARLSRETPVCFTVTSRGEESSFVANVVPDMRP